MKLSLSGRIVEKNGLESAMSIEDFLNMASSCGYDAVDLRWSQFRPEFVDEKAAKISELLAKLGLDFFAAQYNGPLDTDDDVRTFVNFAGTLKKLGAHGIRMFSAPDVLKKASRLAAPFGLKVQYQMHTNSPFETIAGGAQVVADIDEPNFGLVPEPANFALAGLKFSEDMLEPLKGRIAGVHVQTLVVAPDAQNALQLCDGRVVRYTRVPYAANDCIPFPVFFKALYKVGFDGYVNELEPMPADGDSEAMAKEAAHFLKQLI